ncbi:MAG TPA: DUF72 domain-containing protein [Acidimicrobiales bacterium]|nr:DUF72 domain-containing protein [Acidimicrobiales bacterium]
MAVLVGTSGWQYDHWRGTFYPAGLPKARWLEYYADRFGTVESNSAFYRLPERRTLADWAERTPDDFVVAVKASRYLTHVRRLRDPGEAVRRLVDRLEGLGSKRGPVLLQLPPTLQGDADALAATLAAFPPTIRVAVEPRHPSWFVDDVRRLLERAGAALCLTDTRGRHPPLWRTADWGYVRFHQGRAAPEPCYGRTALAGWAERIARLWGPADDVYCYFNNDPRGCAPRDAVRFAGAAGRIGLQPTRVPSPRTLSVDGS